MAEKLNIHNLLLESVNMKVTLSNSPTLWSSHRDILQATKPSTCIQLYCKRNSYNGLHCVCLYTWMQILMLALEPVQSKHKKEHQFNLRDSKGDRVKEKKPAFQGAVFFHSFPSTVLCGTVWYCVVLCCPEA